MIKFDQENYTLQENESLLDCLLRHGVAVPHSCRNGICQTCLMKAVKGNPTAASQKGLKESQVSQNYFLACACYPQNDLEVILPDAKLSRRETSVIEKTFLSDSVLRLRLRKPDDFSYFAGQFLTIFKTDTVGRSYSLASVPDLDDYLEFHIHLIPDGEVSPWLAHEIKIGDSIAISEAIGNCIYIGAATEQPLLLIGTGTGMAALIGIVKQALHSGHSQPINIYHGVKSYSNLYLDSELRALTEQHPNVNYFPCVTREPPMNDGRQGRANELAVEDGYDLKEYSIYLCGNPDMVNNTKRQLFLAGASLQNIHADPFVFG